MRDPDATLVDLWTARARRDTAIHECAHAAAAEVAGYRVTQVVLTDNGGGRCYLEVAADDGYKVTESGRHKSLSISLAGPLASRRLRADPSEKGTDRYAPWALIDTVLSIDLGNESWQTGGSYSNDLWHAAAVVSGLSEEEARAELQEAIWWAMALLDVEWDAITDRADGLLAQGLEPVSAHPVPTYSVEAARRL